VPSSLVVGCLILEDETDTLSRNVGKATIHRRTTFQNSVGLASSNFPFQVRFSVRMVEVEETCRKYFTNKFNSLKILCGKFTVLFYSVFTY
jgi:hypothetical protein